MIFELLSVVNLVICATGGNSTGHHDSYFDIDENVTDEELLEWLALYDEQNTRSGNFDSFSGSELDYLEDKYPDYAWNKIDEKNISDVSGNEIVCIQYDGTFPYSDVMSGLAQSNSQSTYGGCGPIAMIGVFDYFARHLGYDEIMQDPTSENDRIELTRLVFNYTPVINIDPNHTFTFSADYVTAFQRLLALEFDYNLYLNVIRAYHIGFWGGGHHNDYWPIITTSIANGMPVTMSYLGNDYGTFSKHYTNIYAYSTWRGTSNSLELKTVNIIKAKHNLDLYPENDYICCESSILDEGMVNLIYYDIDYSQCHSFDASSFQYDFVNGNGGGQYFFYPIDATVHTGTGYGDNDYVYTTRLRSSYIENEYLVMSPKRQGAGTAYITFTFSHPVERVSFDASLWSASEYIDGQSFYAQYYDYSVSNFVNHVEYDLTTFSTNKNNLKNYVLLFKKGVYDFRLYTNTIYPTGIRNKGRIVLDNFNCYYN